MGPGDEEADRVGVRIAGGSHEAPGGEEGYAHSGWVFDFLGPEQERDKLDETLDAEALLLGRVTYEGLAAMRRHACR